MNEAAASAMNPKEEVHRLAAALRTAIRLSGVSYRQIERELGMSTGYLTRILGGQVELRVSHILSICKVIELPVGSFFTALFPFTRLDRDASARLTQGLATLHRPPVEHPRQARDPEALLAELRGYLHELRNFLEEEDS